ncbi:MAG: hypothetical protein KAY24_15620 [Candidatus Eisenbacteria sp.]|nr:hypothetical protein [Candidatus Eisenbacteria bacterium]
MASRDSTCELKGLLDHADWVAGNFRTVDNLKPVRATVADTGDVAFSH